MTSTTTSAGMITKKEDIRDLFVPSFYFGCEADDPANAWAFTDRRIPFGARLHAIFGSDIGHWDVPDMTDRSPRPTSWSSTGYSRTPTSGISCSPMPSGSTAG